MANRGRPTKFKKEMVEKAEQYMIDYKKEEDEAVPTIEGLSLYLKIPRQKIYEYTKKDKDFRDIIEVIRTLQAKRLLTGGLLNKFNSIITRLMLAKHGYKEETKTEIEGEITTKVDKKSKAYQDFLKWRKKKKA